MLAMAKEKQNKELVYFRTYQQKLFNLKNKENIFSERKETSETSDTVAKF